MRVRCQGVTIYDIKEFEIYHLLKKMKRVKITKYIMDIPKEGALTYSIPPPLSILLQHP
ncbi:MAG: hypothetical protein WAM14_02575 [Candidatus Nitrosopolaris sp.]